MLSSNSKRFAAAAAVLVIIAGSFIAGSYVATRRSLAMANSAADILNKDAGRPDSVDFALFWKAWKILDEKYVATKVSTTTTDQDKVWGAIEGLAASYGDPYTVFFPPTETKNFQSEINGNLEGIGVEIDTRDGVITVVTPLKDTPAYKAGIMAGDKILKIDDTITANLTPEQAVSKIRGKKGTSVRLTVLRQDEKLPREITITRDVINVPTIDTELRKDGVFVINLYTFTADSPSLFRNALKEFVMSNSNKLILDLRNNPGGYLDAAVDMASWFLPADKVVVREDAGEHGDDLILKSRGYNIFNKNLKMAIVVDGGSASASEILAGALNEHGVAKLVGAKTYGKGSVQELVSLTPETSLKITIARWLTPNGTSISDHGLTPDVEVKVTQEDLDKNFDAQLEKAAELLNK